MVDSDTAMALELDITGITDFLDAEQAHAEQHIKVLQAHFTSYLSDLKSILILPGGAGIRVVRHWLDSAAMGQRMADIPDDSRLRAAAALHDYGHDRMAEIAMADPSSLVRIQLEGARQWGVTTSTHNVPSSDSSEHDAVGHIRSTSTTTAERTKDVSHDAFPHEDAHDAFIAHGGQSNTQPHTTEYAYE